MIQKRKTTAAKKYKKKAPVKKAYTMEIHESIERIANGKLSEMGLFELSIHALMPTDVYRELKKRIELIQTLLRKTKIIDALEIVNNLLKSPQKTRR